MLTHERIIDSTVYIFIRLTMDAGNRGRNFEVGEETQFSIFLNKNYFTWSEEYSEHRMGR